MDWLEQGSGRLSEHNGSEVDRFLNPSITVNMKDGTVLEIDAGDARPANQSLHFVQQVAGRRGAEVCEKYLRRSHVLNKLG